ncbi:hypothetical protein CEUSTIGMA_g3903.t1 [Chlamydomonas eustigma]|uniref:CRC domain-containing protein n=1 Tax=Chlamydomonas eustigma TaxID=1157962 RepID=A0A250X060_9CHLO|nr:hypothetical protein CEUSTIGMA_g3903.t1 [Chlamydomonas eustigma]|eukprot:GAX76458.1 hypothetical protein CEUSTIGMA_g3903.t1 [Chlamydomonas eustigma]
MADSRLSTHLSGSLNTPVSFPQVSQQVQLPPLLSTPGAQSQITGLSSLGLIQSAAAAAAAGYRPPPAGAAHYYTQPLSSQIPHSPSSNRKPTPTGPPRSGGGGSSAKKQCNCKNSRCLKLYCECFASGRYCDACNCVNCFNNRENEGTRQSAVEAILERNPNAFRPKIQGSESEAVAARAVIIDGNAPRHTKGCNCKKSTCLKKYCECFQAGIFCSDICKCMDCKNYDGSEARAQVMAVQDMGVGPGGPLSSVPSLGGGGMSNNLHPAGTVSSLLSASSPKKMRSNTMGSGQGLATGSFLSHNQLQQPGAGSFQQRLSQANSSSGSQSQRSHAQQVVSELVRPNVIEELCKLLFLATEEEEKRISAAEVDKQPALLTSHDGGHTTQPMEEDEAVVAQGGDEGCRNGAMTNGTSTSSCHAKMESHDAISKLQAAQERVVLEEFSSFLGKISETACKRTFERQSLLAALAAQQQRAAAINAGQGEADSSNQQRSKQSGLGNVSSIGGPVAHQPSVPAPNQYLAAAAAAAAAMMQAMQQQGFNGSNPGGLGAAAAAALLAAGQQGQALNFSNPATGPSQAQQALNQLQAVFMLRQQQAAQQQQQHAATQPGPHKPA